MVNPSLHVLCRTVVTDEITDKRMFNNLRQRLRTILSKLSPQGSGKEDLEDSDMASNTELDTNFDSEDDSAINTSSDACIAPTPTLMGLPVELRIMIHRYALQDVIDHANANVNANVFETPDLNFGGLALGNSHRILRAEVHDIFVPMIMKVLQQQVDHNFDLVSRFEQSRTRANRKAMNNSFEYASRDAMYLGGLAESYASHGSRELFQVWLTMINKRLEMEMEIYARKYL